jgi:hypothetical protein
MREERNRRAGGGETMPRPVAAATTASQGGQMAVEQALADADSNDLPPWPGAFLRLWGRAHYQYWKQVFLELRDPSNTSALLFPPAWKPVFLCLRAHIKVSQSNALRRCY